MAKASQGKAPAKAAEEAGAEKKQKKPRSTEGVAEAKAAAKMTSAEWKELQVGMAEEWPAPQYMTEPHAEGKGHNCYRDETYEIITRWTAETRIAYRPHAKSPGSKSHLRYEHYSAATTVAEAFELGSWPADWCWDYERGFVKVEGPLRDEPIDITKVSDCHSLTDVDKAIHRWYLRELARNLDLNVKDLAPGKGGGESLVMRAHRLVAQREAKKRLADAEREGSKVSEDDVLKVLQEWAFARNVNRQNVMPEGKEFVWSDTIGLLRDRIGDIHVTASTKTYPEVLQILNKYLSDRLPPEAAGFKWTSLNLNCNYAAKLHRDGNNFGPSFIKAFGDFSGGLLNYWPQDDRKDKLEALRDEDKVQLDLKNNLALFNGNCGHAVSDFLGERFSVVYFTISCFDKAPEECKAELQGLGINYPAADEDPYALLSPPRGYGEGSGAIGGLPRTPSKEAAETSTTFQCWPTAGLDGGAPRIPGRVLRMRPAATPAKAKRKEAGTEAPESEAASKRCRGGDVAGAGA